MDMTSTLELEQAPLTIKRQAFLSRLASKKLSELSGVLSISATLAAYSISLGVGYLAEKYLNFNFIICLLVFPVSIVVGYTILAFLAFSKT